METPPGRSVSGKTGCCASDTRTKAGTVPQGTVSAQAKPQKYPL
jgi:hypothetical protein